MFVRDFAQLDRPFSAVAPSFGDDLEWMSPLAEGAAHLAICTAAELFSADICRAGRDLGDDATEHPALDCRFGPPRAQLDSLVLPVEVNPAIAHHAFPPLHAHLELAPLGPERTLLSLDASYQAPVPDAATAAVLQRATQIGIRKLVADIACHLGGGGTP